MRIGSAISAGLKGFSSDSPKNSAECNMKTMTKSDQCRRARLTKGKFEKLAGLYTQGLRRLKFQSHNEGTRARRGVRIAAGCVAQLGLKTQ
jgi:hypothetical protein